MSGHSHQFSVENANKLLSEDREQLLPLDQVIDKMAIQREDVVADLGAGNGFFTLPVAKMTDGIVYAVDIEPKMLDLLKNRADAENMHNIQYVAAGLEDTGLPTDAVDHVLVSMVLHEVPHLSETLHDIRRILKPDGHLCIVEWEAVPSEDGPPAHIRLASEAFMETLQQHGFTQLQVNHLQDAVYTIHTT